MIAFKAKAYDVLNKKYIDTDFTTYSFGTFLDIGDIYNKSGAVGEIPAPLTDYVFDDNTNFAYRAFIYWATYQKSRTNSPQIKFCLTDDLNDKYLEVAGFNVALMYKKVRSDGPMTCSDWTNCFSWISANHYPVCLLGININTIDDLVNWEYTASLAYETDTQTYRVRTADSPVFNDFSGYVWPDIVNNFIDFININPSDIPDSGGNSDTGGGTGDFDNSSDDIDFSELPILSATDAGFVTIYTPTTSQLKSLAKYMWTTDFVDVIKKLFGDPMDAILGLSIVPVNIPSVTSKEVTVGFVGTGVTMPVATDQYIGFDCGTLNINEYWGSALDYSPYTKANIFLPYIGFRQLSTDDIMGKAVHLKYRIDILSGACTAQIKCGGSVIYQFSGSCAASLPVSGRDFSDIVRNAISIAGSTGAMIASGGMSAPISAGVVTAGLTTTANNVMGMKPHIQHSGAVSGSGGLLGLQTPFLILERPRQSLAKGYKTHLGYPSNISAKLSTLKGYTRVEEIHLDNMTCTDKECEEIYQKLRQGVII